MANELDHIFHVSALKHWVLRMVMTGAFVRLFVLQKHPGYLSFSSAEVAIQSTMTEEDR